ncbi:replication-associated protein [robinz virus RP_736]|uniref:Replication-associated protein n=1 Tax=robinz virus RP_736 TaxID=2886402 RepID=A0A8K1PHD2_9CIRC|nr:replication-associated protein [robinz virus RP_736]UDN67416.1 replication-associated protein [robinz virus RP_736]
MRIRRQMKRISFTLNNYTEEDEQRIQQSFEFFQYAIYGRETAPTTGTRHLQGFINFKSKRELCAIKAIIGDRAHIEASRGTDHDNKTYCSKDGDMWEFGTPVGQGKRNDLEALSTDIKDGLDLYSVVEKHTSQFIRYSRGIERAIQILNGGRPGCGRNFKTEFIVYCGETGSGKSYTAAQQCVGQSVYYKPHGKWWDGYTGQENVIIDDFYGWIKYDEILRITDRYPHQVEIKGGFQEFRSKRVFITSNAYIESWWRKDWFTEEKVKPLRRRLDIYEDFSIINGQTVRTDLNVVNNISEFFQ